MLRTAAPVQHPYWGSFCHNFAGMTAHKDTFALDYCHNPDELVGHFSHLDASSGELRKGRRVVPFQADDRASEFCTGPPPARPTRRRSCAIRT